MKGFSTPMRRLVAIAVVAYAAVVICLWLAVDVLADRAWPATILAFGPRWPAALPLLPLALTRRRCNGRPCGTETHRARGGHRPRSGFRFHGLSPGSRTCGRDAGPPHHDPQPGRKPCDRRRAGSIHDSRADRHCRPAGMSVLQQRHGAPRLAFPLRRKLVPGEPLPVYPSRRARSRQSLEERRTIPIGTRSKPRWDACSC